MLHEKKRQQSIKYESEKAIADMVRNMKTKRRTNGVKLGGSKK